MYVCMYVCIYIYIYISYFHKIHQTLEANLLNPNSDYRGDGICKL